MRKRVKIDWQTRSRLVDGLFTVHDCPSCEYNFVVHWFRFCPWCGARIKWLNGDKLFEDADYCKAIKEIEKGFVSRCLRKITKTNKGDK